MKNKKMNYIKGKCYTNLDDYDCSLVTKFAEIPKIDDKVIVRMRGGQTTLSVCQITHDERDGEPFIHVELTRRI